MKWKSKPQWDITSHLLEWLLSKTQEITSIREDVAKKKKKRTLGRTINLVQPPWKTLWKFLKKSKNRTVRWFSNSTSGYLSEGNKNTNSKRYLHAPHDHWSIIYNLPRHGKQSKCPSTDEWIKENMIYITESYLAIKEGNLGICNNRDGTWRHYAKWTMSDRERDKYCMIALMSKM